MKKSVVIAALGLAVGAVSSFGQGSIGFNSYYAGSSGATKVSFFGSGTGQTSGTLVGAGTSAGLYSVDVLYSLTPISDLAGNGALTAGWLTSGSGAPSANNLLTGFETGTHAGWFNPGVNFVDNTYSSGLVYFEVYAWVTSAGSYANATVRGHSASFSTTLATGLILPATSPQYSSWTVSAVPEPTTLALAGLGGLAALIGFRRKNV